VVPKEKQVGRGRLYKRYVRKKRIAERICSILYQGYYYIRYTNIGDIGFDVIPYYHLGAMKQSKIHDYARPKSSRNAHNSYLRKDNHFSRKTSNAKAIQFELSL
jgi:hypothetical protein